ncbi:hypothetical protein D3C78_1461780 [compost metagenome]
MHPVAIAQAEQFRHLAVGTQLLAQVRGLGQGRILGDQQTTPGRQGRQHRHVDRLAAHHSSSFDTHFSGPRMIRLGRATSVAAQRKITEKNILFP